MILKVQMPLAGADLALIYSEDRSVMAQVPVTAPLRSRMGKRPKAFFHADVRAGEIEIGDEAPWQEW